MWSTSCATTRAPKQSFWAFSITRKLRTKRSAGRTSFFLTESLGPWDKCYNVFYMVAKAAKRLLVFVVLFGAGVTTYWYVAQTRPCARPISYRIGVFDTRFGISRDGFLSALDEASGIWEKAAGKDLFIYAPDGKVAVNLVFDERQKETVEQKALKNKIDELQGQYEAQKAFLASRTKEYKTQSQAYESLYAQYREKVSLYESQVRYWNRRGGASEKDYQALIERKRELEDLQKALEAKRAEVNRLADEVNVLVASVNALAQKTNATVDEYNGSDLVGREFDQGLYLREGGKVSVTIYQFTDHGKLVRVLAHESGHVLGLDHNNNPESIMYALNRDDNEELSVEDLYSLKETCRLGTI